ncbi:MAG: SagB/ThcOx family dehydrogenase [Terriglobales bacterium]
MPNRDAAAAFHYHETTKHSPISVRTNAHYLDFGNQPLPFKIYTSVPVFKLPQEFPQTGIAALSAIAESVRPESSAVPDLTALAQILYFSAGITRARKYPGGEIYFRAASNTGALYEIDLYVVCGDLDGLDAGLYHFSPAEFGLRKLRPGDYRGMLMAATAGEQSVEHAPATIVCTGTYWRNAWKYQARTYRHFGWDNGTLLANMLAIATGRNLAAKVVMGFVDEQVNRLLDVDTEREVAFSLVPIGWQSEPVRPAALPVEPLRLETVPVSRSEVDYPLMRDTHAASSLVAADEVREWREHVTPSASDAEYGGGQHVPLAPLADDEIPGDPIEKIILRRGSTRQFSHEPISFAQLSTVLERSSRGFPADFHRPSHALLNEMYLIVNAVDRLAPGAYYFRRERRELELLKAGSFRAEARFLGLEQDLPGDAAANIFFMADLSRILETYGNRGYRAVQLEAGVLGGKMYLAAYALGFGATGLTFYDDEVTNFFSPHAAGKSAIFLMCLGRKLKAATGTGR